ncbi:MAG: Omp28-related outer membrane protein [Bacteroidales bacterium]|nr:Omp28-related outer membrane protein [Bacteroidales bacterium]
MKENIKSILCSIVLISLMVFLSCDNIEEDNFLVYPKGQTSQSTPITKNTSKQRILLEDYTGWKCTNCPRAAQKAAELITKYGEELVVMAVHSTSWATPSAANNNLDFRTEYGEKWADKFSCTALPTGLISRINSSGTFTNSDATWDNKIQEALSLKEHIMDINLGVELKEDNKVLVSTENVFLKPVSYPTLISIMIVESGIKGVQLNGDATFGAVPKIEDYTFNHVLRKNALIDYSLSSNGVESGTTISKNYILDIDNDIKDIENCEVIVFVSNSQTSEIVQVNHIEIQ